MKNPSLIEFLVMITIVSGACLMMIPAINKTKEKAREKAKQKIETVSDRKGFEAVIKCPDNELLKVNAVKFEYQTGGCVWIYTTDCVYITDACNVLVKKMNK